MLNLPTHQADQVHCVSILPLSINIHIAMQRNILIKFPRNDAVIPIADSYSGCPADPHGLCAFDNVVSVLKDRIDEIDFDYDCFGDYAAESGVDYNGRAPKSS